MHETVFFFLVFDGCLCQALAASSDIERSNWVDAIRGASYEGIRAELNTLRQCVERKRSHKSSIDISMWRVQRGQSLGVF